MINLDSISTETFQILRSFDLTLAMYGEDGNAVSEPEEARRMFASPKNILVSIVDDNDNSTLRLYIGKSTHLKKDAKMRRLIQSLRNCASKYNMMFKVRRHSKELKPKDFATKASVTEGNAMNQGNQDYKYYNEGKSARPSSKNPYPADTTANYYWQLGREDSDAPMAESLTEGLYGTSRSSYLALENARMIIRHKSKINEEIAGARSRMIESILIENGQGERFLMPSNQLAPARAMTQHVNQGGSFADEVGGHILRMGQAFSDLGQASHFIGVNNAALPEGAMPIREKCMGKRKSMRRSFARLAKESTYTDECNALKETYGAEPLVEAAVLENLRNLLTMEGKELDESILQTVATHIHEGEERMLDEDDAPQPEISPTIKVLGYDVNREVLSAFMKGQLEFATPPRLGKHQPDYKTKTDEIMFKIGAVAPVVKDDVMSMLLSDVPARYEREQDPERRKVLLKMAITALAAAKMPISEQFGSRGINAILEHEAWFDQFTPNKVLFESAMDDEDCDKDDCEDEAVNESDEDDCEDCEESLDEAFDEEKLSTRNEDREDDELEEGIFDRFHTHRNRDINFQGIRYSLGLEGNIITSIDQQAPGGVRVVPLSHPLATKIAQATNMRLDTAVTEDFEDTDLDAEAFEADPMESNVGLDEDEGDLIESEFADCDLEEGEDLDEELTREDVLLPKNPGLDLAREVSAHDDEEDDAALDESIDPEVARIIELSRIR